MGMLETDMQLKMTMTMIGIKNGMLGTVDSLHILLLAAPGQIWVALMHRYPEMEKRDMTEPRLCESVYHYNYMLHARMMIVDRSIEEAAMSLARKGKFGY